MRTQTSSAFIHRCVLGTQHNSTHSAESVDLVNEYDGGFGKDLCGIHVEGKVGFSGLPWGWVVLGDRMGVSSLTSLESICWGLLPGP